MGINFNGGAIKAIKYNSLDIAKLMYGSELLWQLSRNTIIEISPSMYTIPEGESSLYLGNALLKEPAYTAYIKRFRVYPTYLSGFSNIALEVPGIRDKDYELTLYMGTVEEKLRIIVGGTGTVGNDNMIGAGGVGVAVDKYTYGYWNNTKLHFVEYPPVGTGIFPRSGLESQYIIDGIYSQDSSKSYPEIGFKSNKTSKHVLKKEGGVLSYYGEQSEDLIGETLSNSTFTPVVAGSTSQPRINDTTGDIVFIEGIYGLKLFRLEIFD